MTNRLTSLTLAATLLAALLAGTAPLSAQTCRVCVGAYESAPRSADASAATRAPQGQIEQGELLQTLTNLGYETVVVADPGTETCGVALSYPGCDSCFDFPDLSWIQAGHGYVQISDWGPGFQANAWVDIAEGAPIQVEVVNASHPLTQGLPAQWTSNGFWRYDVSEADYVGWVIDPDPNLARADGHDFALSTRTDGAGNLVYIGWNVYGSQATATDLVVLQNAIGYACVPAAPQTADWIEVPTLSHGALAALAALLAAAALLVLKR
jgi:hypothetical protein